MFTQREKRGNYLLPHWGVLHGVLGRSGRTGIHHMMKERETCMSTSSVGIRDGIAHTREQLADTAETLGHKVEVPAGVVCAGELGTMGPVSAELAIQGDDLGHRWVAVVGHDRWS